MSTRSIRHAVWRQPVRPAPATATARDRAEQNLSDRTATDRGYTLIEMLMVVVILGTLLGAAILALSGVTTEAAATGCDADRRQLHVAVGAYQAQTGNETITPAPATGTDADRYERTLVERGFLRTVSEFHHVDATGAVTVQESSSC